MTSIPCRRIALVGFPGVQSIDLVGPLEVFSMANRISGRHLYQAVLASCTGREIVCNSGLRIGPAAKVSALPRKLDTILVGGGDEDAIADARRSSLPRWLLSRKATTRRLGSVCSGALVLAASGLLDGRRATTHWSFCESLRAAHPEIRVEPDAIFVADPPLYTSAGVTAGIDLVLSMVESDCGAELALAIARNLVLFLRRAGGQTQFSPALNRLPAGERRLQRLLAQIVSEPNRATSVAELATKACMSERNFSRVFKRETGLSPARFVEAARVERAKSLLENTSGSLKRVAERAGFGSVDTLHRAFLKKAGSTPGDYRRRFGPLRPAISNSG